MFYTDHAGTNKGILVKHEDGRKGIVYHKDQKKQFNGKDEGKVLVTMTDEDFKPRDVMKHIIAEDKLEWVGYLD